MADPQPIITYSLRKEVGVRALLGDIVDGARRYDVWKAFAWEETKQRFNRSVLGLAWIAVSFLIFVLAIALFFRGFTAEHVAHVAIGLAIYQFLVGIMQDGCTVFVQANGWIRSSRLPYSIYIFKSIARSLFPFLIHAVVIAVLLPFMGWRPSWENLLAIPIFALFLFNGIWVQYLMGILCARWRDINHLTTAIARLLFFTTPILWRYEDTDSVRRLVADFNPFTHFVQVFRATLVEGGDSMLHWYVIIAFTICGWALTLVVASLWRRHIPLWVD